MILRLFYGVFRACVNRLHQAVFPPKNGLGPRLGEGLGNAAPAFLPACGGAALVSSHPLEISTQLQKVIVVLHNSTMRMSPYSLLFRESLASETNVVHRGPGKEAAVKMQLSARQSGRGLNT